MNLHNKFTTGALPALLALSTLALFGCGVNSATGNNSPQPDFSYETEEKNDETGLTIAAVKPDLVDPDVIAPEPEPGTPAFAVAADGYTVEAQMQIGLMDPDKTADRFRAMYEAQYAAKLRTAANNAITTILKDKGFNVQPVESYDDVVGNGKEQGFLTSLPNYTLGIGNETSSTECEKNICTQKGKLLIDGQYLYQMAEPHTGTTVAYRRMNLYGLRIEEPYTIQTYETEPGALVKVKNILGMNEALVDTSQQALADGLTRLYQNTMAETERTISRPQILALKDTIDRLKNSETP